ncbi:MAG: Uma2 family endonuclease, partial [Microcystis sp.]
CRVEAGEFDWFRLTNEVYIKLEPNSVGIFCSQILPGLWLDRDALLAGDLARVLEVLQLGIARIKN